MAMIINAEDDELVAAIVQHTLMDAGHVVGVVPNGREALRVVRSRRPDLLILDINMPEMNGSEVLDTLRRDPELYDLPILMLTARRGEQDEFIAVRAGATDYLRKPFDPDQLVVVVEDLLERYRAMQAKKRPSSIRQK